MIRYKIVLVVKMIRYIIVLIVKVIRYIIVLMVKVIRYIILLTVKVIQVDLRPNALKSNYPLVPTLTMKECILLFPNEDIMLPCLFPILTV